MKFNKPFSFRDFVKLIAFFKKRYNTRKAIEGTPWQTSDVKLQTESMKTNP